MTNDRALHILLELLPETADDLPTHLVEAIYNTELRFLFEKDQAIPLNAIEQIVTDFVDSDSQEGQS